MCYWSYLSNLNSKEEHSLDNSIRNRSFICDD